MAVTKMSNDQWAARKGYANLAAYNVVYDTPNATALDALRDDAHAIYTRHVGSTSVTDTDFFLSLEYRIVEVLRLMELAIQQGNLELLLQIVDQLLNIIPSPAAKDLALDAEDAKINRGTTSG